MKKEEDEEAAGLLLTAARLASILGTDDCLLVGGLAVAAHGYVRATDDIDFVTRLGLQVVQQRLFERGIPTTLKRGDLVEGDFSCVKGILDGVRFDIMPALVPLAFEAAIDLPQGEESLRVVDLDGLLRLKFRAGGPQDLMDVAFLLYAHPDMRVYARELAKAHGLASQLESWLTDRRIRSQAEDMLRVAGPDGKKASSSRKRARARKRSR